MTYSSEVHDKGDPFSKLLEETLLEKFISIVMFIMNGITTDSKTFTSDCTIKSG